MNTNGNGHTNDNARSATEFDEADYDELIVSGQGKLEGMTFSSNTQIEQAVDVVKQILKAA